MILLRTFLFFVFVVSILDQHLTTGNKVSDFIDKIFFLLSDFTGDPSLSTSDEMEKDELFYLLDSLLCF